MISLLAAAAIQSAKVSEWLDTTVNVVTLQAVIKLPPLSQKQTALLRLVAGTLGEETDTYSGAQIADTAARTGSRLRATLMEDHLRIGMDVVPADINMGLSMMGAVLKGSVVKPESLQRVADDLQFRHFPYWRLALDRFEFLPPKYSSVELQELLTTVFRPENIYLGVGGKLTPGVATRKWEDFVADWKPSRLPRPDVTPAKPLPPPSTGTEVSVIEFAAPNIVPTDAAFSTKLLALTALGTGKGGALWRVAREKLSMSYRQEATLYPTMSGFQPRFLVVHAGKEDIDKKTTSLKEGLLEDIKGWTEEDKRRAIGMCESYLVRGGDYSPLYFAVGRPLDRGIADQVFLQAYWRMKTGNQWSPHQLVGRMGFIELADLKQTAEEMISKADVRIYPAHSNSGS